MHQFEVAIFKYSMLCNQETRYNKEELFTYPINGIVENSNTPTFSLRNAKKTPSSQNY